MAVDGAVGVPRTAAGDLAGRTAATLAESGARIVNRHIRSLHPRTRLAGPAFTVATAPGHNLWLHRAIYQAQPGDVLVVSTQGGSDFGYWGEVMTRAAVHRGIQGLLIDGCVRDADAVAALDFTVFARGTCVRGTGKHDAGGGLGNPVAVGDVIIEPGDIVIADSDGAVIVPRGAVAAVALRAADRDLAEQGIFGALDAGRTTLELYGFDPGDHKEGQNHS